MYGPGPRHHGNAPTLLHQRNRLEFADASQPENSAQLFRAAEVHLSRPDEVDLVVVGIPPMRGANNDCFWLASSARQNSVVVLFASANTLEITNSKNGGYRDIESVRSTPSKTSTETYSFDGESYKLWKEK
jgi:hypothetical protein